MILLKKNCALHEKIVVDKRDTSKSITIINNIFVDNLAKFGMVKNKSKRFLPDLDEKLMPHFIRGMFDGDGSITHKESVKRRNTQWCIVMLAHEKLIIDIKKFLVSKLSLNDNVLCHDGKNVFSARWSSKHDFLALTHYIYDNATICLKRKFLKFQEAVNDFSLR